MREYWEAVHPHTAGGSYINLILEEGEDRMNQNIRRWREGYDADRSSVACCADFQETPEVTDTPSSSCILVA